ncbi:hypothetical protein CPJCM30710_22660 [Clostridium polyendosporum]|uniref:Small, acid-soluble spore protein H n=1 Tax=Clostridium polyendosporum TaxID=69208 RepID=A0A919RZT5_9CLOT|nr:H-type small acid-soluble spore protein [Clostridium polyendosporum]GIM29600.1 hypothetical protein CPJCM30710_22660 [Clostridium polyendosporum]
MDVKRANEIVESLGVINVTYKGNSVWIENINEVNNEAKVKDINTEKVFTVEVSDLKEG